jgi:hypothetical protein
VSKGWGPWIEHDQKHVPPGIAGKILEVEYDAEGKLPCGTVSKGYVGIASGNSRAWIKFSKIVTTVARYRIKKPKGLIILESILADLPAPVSPPRVEA